ncbi:MlaD family protein [Sunxiuqinia sp. A32]|uniref:MlaD family protein n=1 Tax=Sunxiuqinia sp. A32 TaxID=3461496 RepID=UPI004046839B
MKLSRYTKLGILVVLSIAIFIWGLNYLKGIDFFNNNTSYVVVYDHVDGLLESSAVTLNGYQVGQVKDIDFSEKKDGSLAVVFSLEGDFRIPRGSTARIVSSDIMGTKSIKLQIEQSDQYYESYDTIPGSIESDLKEQVSMQVLPLKNKAEQLLASLDSAITVVTYVFNAEARKNLSESFERINNTILNLELTSNELKDILSSENGNIKSTIGNLNAITTNLADNSDEISTVIENFASVSDSIAAINFKTMLEQIAESAEGMNNIITKLTNGEGSAGLLLNDEELYNNLNSLSASLDNLMKDIRQNPKRYVQFSAFDLGKDIYITSREPVAPSKDDQYKFKVHLISSPTRLDTSNIIFDGLDEIEEVSVGGLYNYMVGSTSDFQEITKIHSVAKLKFPEASIVAFKNDRKIKLEKALRRISNN